MEQKKNTEPTIVLENACTAEEFKEQVSNIRETLRVLLINANPTFNINAQMIGKFFDTLDMIDTLNIVDDWQK